MYLGNSATRWLFHPNALGSTGMVTDETGASIQDTTFYPWGQEWQQVGSLGNWQFAGFQPTEPGTQLYPTLFRHFAPSQGRWLSPDPLAGDITNPQSLNRYAYALNNPTTLIDPLGLDDNHGAPPCGPNPDQKPCPQPEPPGQFQASVGQPPYVNIPVSLGAPDLPNALGQYDNTMMQIFLTQCTSGGSCGQSVAFNGVTYTWVQAYQNTVTINGASYTGPAVPGYWAAAPASGTTPGDNGSPWGFAWIPGLAPMANGLMQATKAATRQVKPSPPPLLREVPGTAPKIQLEDTFLKNIFRLMTEWLNGGGLGRLAPSTVLVPIVSPCVIPSFQNTQMCGGNIDTGDNSY